MTPDQQKRVSKRLSLHLRHEPEGLGLTLQDGGWVEVNVLLMKFSAKYFPLSRDELATVVAGSDKQRFAFDATGTLIRASQGHSVDVDLGLQPTAPPEQLFHGTARATVAAPIVFVVRAGDMSRAGFKFFQSENGVWLTDAVPPEWLEVV